MSGFTIEPAGISQSVDHAFTSLERHQFIPAFWDRRPELWSSSAAVQQTIANRLGWLGVIDFIRPRIPQLTAFANLIKGSGLTDVVLLGMGGSSLAPEVLRAVIGVAPGFPRFRMLDSVDPTAVRDALQSAEHSLFILASKSGSTIEPNVMAAEARRRVQAAGIEWSTRAVAITDEDTALHRRARDERFREVFINPSDIGGRYSALSLFGMVPAALMGIDLGALLDRAADMETSCRNQNGRENPGVALGVLMAASAQAGRDKLTLRLPAAFAAFGLWVEQLIAESTGKQGKGIVPIADEPDDVPWKADRAFVEMTLGDRAALPQRDPVAVDAPGIFIDVPAALALGAEFFRWEMATAVAGFLLGINPFDEPNVQQAKDATRALLDVQQKNGRLPSPEPDVVSEAVTLRVSRAARPSLGSSGSVQLPNLVQASDYWAILAYLPPDDRAFATVLRQVRTQVGQVTGCATMSAYGPRYLHSTGQLHKGGPNSGIFVIVTAEPHEDLPIPDAGYSFGTLEMAQALGDFQSLDESGRRAFHVHLPRREPQLLQHFVDIFLRQ